MNNVIVNLISKIWYQVCYYRYRIRINDLLAQGLKIGKNVTIAPGVSIDSDYPYLISIGDNCTISNNVRILAHDAATFKFIDGVTRIGKVEIKEDCYIGENCIILPGVTIGPNVLIAAGSVVNKDIAPNSCVAGVPARFYAKFDEFIEKHKKYLEERAIFEFSDLHRKGNRDFKRKIIDSVQNSDSYVKGYTGRYPYTLNVD